MADKEKKANVFARMGKRISRWVREMRSELKKVVWPTRAQIINNSWVVVVAVITVGLIIAGLDYVMQTVVNALAGISG
ncbi:MAG: preprotein translocase subunit SecE [Oscillospiraceae bacterium]|nr:preprotein translocase subunit SecE [Oscillospiraceae bacterium]